MNTYILNIKIHHCINKEDEETDNKVDGCDDGNEKGVNLHDDNDKEEDNKRDWEDDCHLEEA